MRAFGPRISAYAFWTTTDIHTYRPTYIYILEKWFPLRGERAHSLKFFVYTIRGLRYQKQNRMEEETEPQT